MPGPSLDLAWSLATDANPRAEAAARSDNRMVALALFDLDNTLVDRTRAFGQAVPRLAEHYGLAPAVAVPFIIGADDDGGVGWPTWMGATIDHFGLATTVEEMQSFFAPVYLDHYRLDGAVADGLRELRADGWRLGIVTNGPPSQMDKITGTGLDRLVDGWAVSDEVGVRKPDRRIFEVAAQRCGAALTTTSWMVGDSAPADMVGARNAGVRSVWLPRGKVWSDGPEPDHRVDDVTQAIALIASSPVL